MSWEDAILETLNPTELRNRAAWYREYATRAGNPGIAESRLRTAEEMEAEADRMELGREPINSSG